MTAYDWLQLRRSLGFGALLGFLTLGVMLATDEPHSSVGMRVARLSAFSPLCGVSAVLLAQSVAARSGERTALWAIGASDARLALGVILGGTALGALGLSALASPWAEPSALFPVIHSRVEWSLDASQIVDLTHGVAFSSAGAVRDLRALGAAAPPLVLQRGAAYALVPLVLVAPAWAALAPGSVRQLGAAGATLLLTVSLLHAVAAGRLPDLALLACVAPLITHLLLGVASVTWLRRHRA